MTLEDVRRTLGISVDRRAILRRLRRLERSSGRRLVTSYGEGRHTRYLVDPGAFSDVISGGADTPDETPTIDDVADEIARTVRDMNERHTAMSVSLRETRAELAAVKKQLADFLSRQRGR